MPSRDRSFNKRIYTKKKKIYAASAPVKRVSLIRSEKQIISKNKEIERIIEDLRSIQPGYPTFSKSKNLIKGGLRLIKQGRYIEGYCRYFTGLASLASLLPDPHAIPARVPSLKPRNKHASFAKSYETPLEKVVHRDLWADIDVLLSWGSTFTTSDVVSKSLPSRDERRHQLKLKDKSKSKSKSKSTKSKSKSKSTKSKSTKSKPNT